MLSKSCVAVKVALESNTPTESCGVPNIKVLPASKSIDTVSSAALSFSPLSICKDNVTLLVESKLVTLIYLVSSISIPPS